MFIVQHRVNTIKDLGRVDKSRGIELDVRYHENDLILDHDPFSHHSKKTERLTSILEHWSHEGPIILNIKTEGIENKCIDLMSKYEIKSWFFLDLSMPFFVKYSKLKVGHSPGKFSGENLAVRYSEHEPIEYALSFKSFVKWVWIDSFTGKPVNHIKLKQLKDAGFSTCIVSPELQGFPVEDIEDFKSGIDFSYIDSVCTKHPSIWEKA